MRAKPVQLQLGKKASRWLLKTLKPLIHGGIDPSINYDGDDGTNADGCNTILKVET
uniref:Uncharacterized protein n=1 Tax=Cucumis melo TaxID=3656 RepID=A0A9I9DKJ7_CUCME